MKSSTNIDGHNLGSLLLITVTACFALVVPLTADDTMEENWHQWRGPLGTGVAPNADPPVEWSETKNVRWKVALPGKGHSTPIIWGDRVFVTTAAAYGDAVEPRYSGRPGAHDNSPVTQHHEFAVLAVNRRDEVTSWATPIIVEHDGLPQLIVSGTGRVRGYDLATGKVIWECGGLSANEYQSIRLSSNTVHRASANDVDFRNCVVRGSVWNGLLAGRCLATDVWVQQRINRIDILQRIKGVRREWH
ncbi:MAG: PQQ-binding-like beta-propeller repeat protein [Planctomycetota bacterium]|nr:PQQ-binding-like beta-propeller repeat protein [Planctomycetota bacterium]